MSIKTFTGSGGDGGGSANEDQRFAAEIQTAGGWVHPPPHEERISMHIARIFHKFHSIFIKHKKYGLLWEEHHATIGIWPKSKKKKRKGTQQILHRKSPHYARLVINLWKIKRKRGPERRCKLLGPSSGGSLFRVHLLHSSFSGRDPECGTRDPDAVSGPVKRDLA